MLIAIPVVTSLLFTKNGYRKGYFGSCCNIDQILFVESSLEAMTVAG